jgi:hypothetical protein
MKSLAAFILAQISSGAAGVFILKTPARGQTAPEVCTKDIT